MFFQSTFSTLAAALDARIISGVSMILFGASMVLAVGFKPLAEVHNTTHDTRHATGFPCH
ncbi:CbtB domain-containing protein [Methylomarinum sp. Ch1-1]|uniref:CbtB domain-containing protein n=1 Tax=Methylomarinum roseum TaxID=3067653 RepID=A0AAU7NRI0_9GAMM|nr:CbtB domain-containing protein [Methylomarinum sp. Ch1-1]MDP4520411.1 CbtB domain-containing protein [Methylomarinum sp. Ch1-1]